MTRRRLALVLSLLLSSLDCGAARADDVSRVFEATPLRGDLVLPYPLDNVFRGFARCRRGRHTHRAIDIGGVGADWGLGTPIRALARAKIVHVGTPESDPVRYGRRDTREGTVARRSSTLPRSSEVPGYGRVHFFTENYGRFRSGVLIVTRVLGGRYDGYAVKYMHLAAVHPAVKRGAVVEAGQELGLMGGTAVQDDPPHLHLAIENRGGRAIDPGPILGIGSTRFRCRGGRAADNAARGRYRKRARALMAQLVRERERVAPVAIWPGQCGRWVHEGEFAPGWVRAHRARLEVPDGDQPVTARVEVVGEGRWRPRLELRTELQQVLFDGNRTRRAGRRLAVRRVHSGRRGPLAELELRPNGVPLQLDVRGWRRPPPGSRYTLVVERRCEAQ